MAKWSEFRRLQYRDDDNRGDAPHFKLRLSILILIFQCVGVAREANNTGAQVYQKHI